MSAPPSSSSSSSSSSTTSPTTTSTSIPTHKTAALNPLARRRQLRDQKRAERESLHISFNLAAFMHSLGLFHAPTLEEELGFVCWYHSGLANQFLHLIGTHFFMVAIFLAFHDIQVNLYLCYVTLPIFITLVYVVGFALFEMSSAMLFGFFVSLESNFVRELLLHNQIAHPALWGAGAFALGLALLAMGHLFCDQILPAFTLFEAAFTTPLFLHLRTLQLATGYRSEYMRLIYHLSLRYKGSERMLFFERKRARQQELEQEALARAAAATATSAASGTTSTTTTTTTATSTPPPSATAATTGTNNKRVRRRRGGAATTAAPASAPSLTALAPPVSGSPVTSDDDFVTTSATTSDNEKWCVVNHHPPKAKR